MKVFDIHTHTYPEAIAEKAVTSLGKFYDFVPEGKGTYADLEESASACDVRGFLLFSVATNAHQVEKVNSSIAALVQKSRENGYLTAGFAGMYQDFPDFEGEINRAASLGLQGVKIHPDIQGIDIDDPKLLPLYEILEGRMPVYFHMGDNRPQYRFSEPKKLRRVLTMFPKLQVVAAHLGGYKATDEAIEYLAGHENVWYDTSSALWYLSTEEATRIIGKLGHEKVMFGSDYPVMYPASDFARFMKIPMTEGQREDILWNNAVRFLHLEDRP
ncbi:MAG: amidohydrolase family protein [Clostridia bacterium]|nr:amidohydrolase family protein [Clostridia bacterium]